MLGAGVPIRIVFGFVQIHSTRTSTINKNYQIYNFTQVLQGSKLIPFRLESCFKDLHRAIKGFLLHLGYDFHSILDSTFTEIDYE